LNVFKQVLRGWQDKHYEFHIILDKCDFLLVQEVFFIDFQVSSVRITFKLVR